MEYVEQRQQRFRNSKYYTLMNSLAKKINPLQAILKMIPSITNSGASFIGFNDLDISKFLIFCTVWSRKLAEVLLWNRKYPMIFFISTEKQQNLWKRNHSVQQILCLNEIINVFVWRCNWLQGANISRNVQLMGYSSPRDGHRIVCNLCKEFPSMVFHSCPVKFKDDFCLFDMQGVVIIWEVCENEINRSLNSNRPSFGVWRKNPIICPVCFGF